MRQRVSLGQLEEAPVALLPPLPLGTARLVARQLGRAARNRPHLLERAEAAGALITDPPHERPWGIYSGYFKDPDGHLWEIIWNPA